MSWIKTLLVMNESDGVLEGVEEGPRKQVESREWAQTGALMQDTVESRGAFFS